MAWLTVIGAVRRVERSAWPVGVGETVGVGLRLGVVVVVETGLGDGASPRLT